MHQAEASSPYDSPIIPDIPLGVIALSTQIHKRFGGWMSALEKRESDECVLRIWVDHTHTNPVTQKLTIGRDVLRKHLYARESKHWGIFSEYVGMLDGGSHKEVQALNNLINRDVRSSFSPLLLKAGIQGNSFADFCFWLKAITEEEWRRIDAKGFLTNEGLLHWCHSGYEDPKTKQRVYGREILIQCYQSGRFWKKLQEYGENLNNTEIAAIGGKFPGMKGSLGARINGDTASQRTNVTTSELFAFFSLAIPENDSRNTAVGGYISPSKLKEWIQTDLSFADPLDKEKIIRVPAKDIFLAAFFSKMNFWKALTIGIENLPRNTVEWLDGKIPCQKKYYYQFSKKADGESPISAILVWLGVLEEEAPLYINERGFLNFYWLKRWCHEGHEYPKTKQRIYGKDLLLQFYSQWDFFNEFTLYANSLELADLKAIGGKLPTLLRSMFLRTGTREIEQLFLKLEILEFKKIQKSPGRNKSTTTSGDLFIVNSKYSNVTDEMTRRRCRIIIGNIIRLSELENITPDAFIIIERDDCIHIRIRRWYLVNKLRPMRNYINDSLIPEYANGLEKRVVFEESME